MATCVSPPSDLNVCVLPNSARVPQEYATTNADVELQSYFAYLDMIDQTPTHKCAEAYIEFACSERYPRCSGDANSGLGYAVNTCYWQCQAFVDACQGQLSGLDRPDCGMYSVSEDCTGRRINVSGASTLSVGFMITLAMTAIVAVL